MLKNKQQYGLLLKNLPCFVFRGYQDWSIESIDNKIELLTGYKAHEFNSKRVKWSDLIVKEDMETVQKIFISALKTDRSYIREYRIKPKTGEPLWVQERSQIICNDKGEIDYVSGFLFDIPELKLVREEKTKIEKKLHQAQQMEAIVTSAGRIAHDFNNILGAIIGHAELMALFDIPEDSPMRSRLDGVLKGAYRARDLVQQILTLGRQREQ